MTAIKIEGVRIHENLTVDVITDAVHRRAVTLDNPGFCIMCGVEHEGVEPDARGYECESCGAECVYGADELLFYFIA